MWTQSTSVTDKQTDRRADGRTELRSQRPCNAERRTVITETINTLFPVVHFLKCVVTEVVLFSIVAYMTLTFHKVVWRHTWGVVGSLATVLLHIFSWFWQWNTFENRLIFGKVKAYRKKWCQIFWATLHRHFELCALWQIRPFARPPVSHTGGSVQLSPYTAAPSPFSFCGLNFIQKFWRGPPERERQTIRVRWGNKLFSSFMCQYLENGTRYDHTYY